jgi:hypothetical protein
MLLPVPLPLANCGPFVMLFLAFSQGDPQLCSATFPVKRQRYHCVAASFDGTAQAADLFGM